MPLKETKALKTWCAKLRKKSEPEEMSPDVSKRECFPREYESAGRKGWHEDVVMKKTEMRMAVVVCAAYNQGFIPSMVSPAITRSQGSTSASLWLRNVLQL
jgi:hypothetical protein